MSAAARRTLSLVTVLLVGKTALTLLGSTQQGPVLYDAEMSPGPFRRPRAPESLMRAPRDAFRLGSGAFESASPSPSYPKTSSTIDPARRTLSGHHDDDVSYQKKIHKAHADGKALTPHIIIYTIMK